MTDIRALSLGAARSAGAVLRREFTQVNPAFSPDGRWIACQSNEPQWQIYVEPFPTTGARVRVSPSQGANPAWSADGRELFYTTATSTRDVMVADMTNPLRPGTPRRLLQFSGLGKIHPFGSRVLVAADVGERAPITVVLNWRPGG